MKLIDLLKVLDKDMFLTISISVHGVQFSTRHSAGFFIDNGDDLKHMKVQQICESDHEFNVRLES